ncbi:MAG: hypothetical protein H8E12_18640 [Rhodobacteraceae bacterium]|nr:hypothetical protein [Paracoccaceae bacterium]
MAKKKTIKKQNISKEIKEIKEEVLEIKEEVLEIKEEEVIEENITKTDQENTVARQIALAKRRRRFWYH